jgi:hypothetical protein
MPEIESYVEKDGALYKEITLTTIHRTLIHVVKTMDEMAEDLKRHNHFADRLESIENNCLFAREDPESPFKKLIAEVEEIKEAQCEAENLSKGRLNLRGDIITMTLFAFAIVGGIMGVINLVRALVGM